MRQTFPMMLVACALSCAATLCAAEPVPLPRRLDAYFPPAPPAPEVNADTGLPQRWYTEGPAPFFGSPYVGWGYGYGYGYAPYYRGAYGYGGFGYGYRGGWPGWGYGRSFYGPFGGYYGPAQAMPGYRTWGPYTPFIQGAIVPGTTLPQAASPEVLVNPTLPAPSLPAQPLIAPPAELPVPSLGP
ncbi:MAG: hypothetical protein QM811_05850 [Pirellulales bacterium]